MPKHPSHEEIAAIDHIAYQLAMHTYDMSPGERSSDKDRQLDLYIEQFIKVREKLLQAITENPAWEDPRRAGTWESRS